MFPFSFHFPSLPIHQLQSTYYTLVIHPFFGSDSNSIILRMSYASRGNNNGLNGANNNSNNSNNRRRFGTSQERRQRGTNGGPSGNSSASSSNAGSARRSPVESDMMHERLVYLFAKSIGSFAVVTVSSGARYRGILVAANTSTDIGVVLEKAEKFSSAPGDDDDDDSNLDQRFERLVFNPKDVVDVEIENLDLTPDKISSRKASTAFKTDTDISGQRGAIYERELQRWNADDESTPALALDDLDSSSQPWDQFEVNENKFGVQSTYDENLYTTAIDRSHPEYKLREKKAEQLADEILKSGHNGNVHLAEERGVQVDDSGLDEEDKYSGVDRRPVSARNPNKYTPPSLRKKDIPLDPAIVSSSRQSSLSQAGAVSATPAPASGGTSTPIADLFKASKGITTAEQSSSKSNPTNNKPLPPSVVLPASSRTSKDSGKLKGSGKTPPDTEVIGKGLAGHFKEFVSVEVEKVHQKKQSIHMKEKSDRIHDFKKFSDNFKINTPVPIDLVPLLGKKKEVVDNGLTPSQIEKVTSDSAKTGALPPRPNIKAGSKLSSRIAEAHNSGSTPRVPSPLRHNPAAIPPSPAITDSSTSASSASSDGKFAAASTTVIKSPPKAPSASVSTTAPKQTSSSSSSGKQAPPQKTQNSKSISAKTTGNNSNANNAKGAASAAATNKQGTQPVAKSSATAKPAVSKSTVSPAVPSVSVPPTQKTTSKNTQSKTGSTTASAKPPQKPFSPSKSPSKPFTPITSPPKAFSPIKSPPKEFSPAETGEKKLNLNFKAPEFRPNPNAHSFTPTFPGSPAAQPVRHRNSFFGTKPLHNKSREGKFNTFLGLKNSQDSSVQFVIPKSFLTPPTWDQEHGKQYIELLPAPRTPQFFGQRGPVMMAPPPPPPPMFDVHPPSGNYMPQFFNRNGPMPYPPMYYNPQQSPSGPQAMMVPQQQQFYQQQQPYMRQPPRFHNNNHHNNNHHHNNNNNNNHHHHQQHHHHNHNNQHHYNNHQQPQQQQQQQADSGQPRQASDESK